MGTGPIKEVLWAPQGSGYTIQLGVELGAGNFTARNGSHLPSELNSRFAEVFLKLLRDRVIDAVMVRQSKGNDQLTIFIKNDSDLGLLEFANALRGAVNDAYRRRIPTDRNRTEYLKDMVTSVETSLNRALNAK